MWKLDFLDSYLTCTTLAMLAVYASSFELPYSHEPVTASLRSSHTTIDGLGSVRLEVLDRLFAVVTYYALHFAILPPFYPVRFASARLYFPNLSVLNCTVHRIDICPMALVQLPPHELNPPSADEISTGNAEQLVLLEIPTEKEQINQLSPPRRNIYLMSAKLALVLILATSYLTFCIIVDYRPIPIDQSVFLSLSFSHCEHYHSY